MRKFYFLLVSMVLLNAGINAQVTITGAAPAIANGTTYTSLTNASGAFAAINLVSSWSGKNIVLTINGNITTESGTNALNQPGTSSWTTLTINPSGISTISGTVAASLISLNGADNVTINGLNTGGNTLTIANLSTSATAGTSTLKFIGDATNNTVTNCTILGSSTATLYADGGTIFFSTGSTTGNDGNTISNCNIGAAGVNLPLKGIYGKGSTASTAIGNSGIIITNNNIYDYFNAVEHSVGIFTDGGCNSWSITNNKFYQTAGRAWTGGISYQHSAIWITNSLATSGAQLFTIAGNIIGYATNTQTGTYTVSGPLGKFIGIYYYGITGLTSTISGNTISAVSLTGITTVSDPFIAIFIGWGAVTSNSNIIGSQSTTGSINVSTTSGSAGFIVGIYNAGTDNWTSNSNTIGGITANNSSTGNLQIYCLRAWIGATLTWTCNNNIIGGTVPNSIQNTTAGFPSRVAGITNDNSIMTATANIVRNLTANGRVEGISNVFDATINSNTISNLTLQSTASSYLGAIISSVGAVSIFSNSINSLTTTGISGGCFGVYVANGTSANVYSNVINTITSQFKAHGIYIQTGTTVNVYSNTIYTISNSGVSSVTGMELIGAPGTIINAYSNTINNLTTSGGTVYGMAFTGAATTVNAYKNKIYDLFGSGANSLVRGAYLGPTSPTTLNFYNNHIGDLRNTIATGTGVAIAGYYSASTTATSTQNVYFNSFYLNAVSSGASFSTAGLYHTGSTIATTASLNLLNNIIVNTSIPTGAGFTAAYRRSNTNLDNFAATSNYNLLYAGTPSPTKVIFYDGTGYQTLAAYQAIAGLAPRDANSITAFPNFVSSTDLHLTPNNCNIDNMGIPIAGFTDDIDADTRSTTTPDIGADEFDAYNAGVLAGVVNIAVCANKAVVNTGTIYTDASCNLIAKVLPSGTFPVAGVINTCVTLDATQQNFNGDRYVQRHYDVEPATSNTTTTSATLTLYFTDAEFVQYNTNNPVRPPLPTIANNTIATRNNVKVTQFHGTPTGGLPTTPGNYTAGFALIIPGEANVVLNGSVWAVTFAISGFSGFYVHTNNYNAPLPIIVNYLTGRRQGSNHLLNWKVTCVSTPKATMTLERSADARNYTGINTITADAARCNQPFDYTDANPLNGMNYYRLKIVDADGKVTYSTTVALLNAAKGFEIISIAPNPVTNGNFKLNVSSAVASKMKITIIDMQGRLVNQQTVAAIAGYNSLPVNVRQLAAGTYTIQATAADEKSKIIRFVKQ